LGPTLVALSFVVAVFASYTALDLAGRVVASWGRARMAWLAGGAFAMGTGIWSMHSTGMLAFKIGMPVNYHVGLRAATRSLEPDASQKATLC
jgi:NO-binding membrane sensor protein with MHYT domain